MENRFLPVLGFAALLALLPAAAWGQTNNFTGPGQGSWNNPANWSLGVIPTSSHTVSITSKTVLLNSAPAATAGALHVQLGSELIILSGASLTASNGNVGVAGTGLLRVSGTDAQAAFLPSGSTASLFLGGPVSTGTLIVENGALVRTGSGLDQGVILGSLAAGTGHIQLSATGSSRGTLATTSIQKLGAGTLTFNGGVLRVLAANPSFLTGFAAGDVTINAGGALIDTNGFNIGVSTPMSGPGALVKQGAGELTLSGANSYAGGTVVGGGAVTNTGILTIPAAETNFTPGGDAAFISGDGAFLRNRVDGTITGGNGARAAGGGAAVSISGNGAFLGNWGTITGGNGGATFGPAVWPRGDGGAGVVISGNDVFFGNAGTITGGNCGDTEFGLGTVGGAGIVISGTGNTFQNDPSFDYEPVIRGGVGIAGGKGGAGILLGGDNNTLVLSGRILGGFDDAIPINPNSGTHKRGNAITVTGGDHTLLTSEYDPASFMGNIEVTAGSSLTFRPAINGYLYFSNVSSITGGGAIGKTGPAVLSLSGANSYAGGTTITEGAISIANVGAGQSVLGTGDVAVGPNGTLAGAGTVLGDTLLEGTLAPGRLPDLYVNSTLEGLLNFAGDLTLSSTATTVMQLGGLHLADYDRILVAGDVIYNGTLSVSFVNGFTPKIGNTFHLFGTFNAEGAFTNILFANPGYEADFDYSQGKLVFTAVAPSLPGDYNNDGVVNAADYVVWRKHEGTSNVLPNDPIGGMIDTDQYDQWRGNFGRTASGGGSATALAAVPEPVGTSLAAVAMLFTWCFTGRFGGRRQQARPLP